MLPCQLLGSSVNEGSSLSPTLCSPQPQMTFLVLRIPECVPHLQKAHWVLPGLLSSSGLSLRVWECAHNLILSHRLQAPSQVRPLRHQLNKQVSLLHRDRRAGHSPLVLPQRRTEKVRGPMRWRERHQYCLRTTPRPPALCSGLTSGSYDFSPNLLQLQFTERSLTQKCLNSPRTPQIIRAFQ